MDNNDRRIVISNELEKTNPDWQLIERMSRALVDNDPHNVRFTVDAGHIQRLGVELVGKQGTALSELIKNAYDADASKIELHFLNKGKQGGTLIISDNGSGMTEEVIRSSWMRIATTDKVDTPVSPLFNRPRAGKKGIGRFAVQRLGKQLELETKSADSKWGFRVLFNWDQSFEAGKDLSDIFSRIEKFKKEPNDTGTTLKILNLRDAWSDSAIAKTWRSVLLLQSPFPLSRPSKEQVDTKKNDPGFLVEIDNESQKDQSKKFSIEDEFLSLASAEITASIDENGHATAKLKSKILNIDESLVLDKKFSITGPTEFSTRYFIYTSEFWGGISPINAAKMGRKYGGIRIYRNGFRVLPYGEPNDDWLSFDADVARRNILVPSSNQNFFGQINLDTLNNPLLEETSSREGLIENEAFWELRDFVRQVIDWSTKLVASVRNKKQTAGQKGYTSPPKKPTEIISGLKKDTEVNNIISGNKLQDSSGTGSADLFGSDTSDYDPFVEAMGAAKKYEEDVERQQAESLQYEQMLRLLASLGLSISVFGHEVKGSQESMKTQLKLLEKRTKKITDLTSKESIEKSHDNISKSANRIFDIGGYISGIMSNTESRTLKTLSVSGAVNRFEEHFSEYLSKQNVSLVKEIKPGNLRTTAMHASEFDSVLLNFLTNSIKSMKKAKVNHRSIKIDSRLYGNYAIIGFEDNGVGIKPEDRDRAFDAFFTTTISSDEDVVAGPGTGLGLKIVQDIAQTYGGSVKFVDPSDGYNCRIEFKILADEKIL